MKVIFRADASIHIGSGHVMRCLTLAEQLRKNGAVVIFICRRHLGNLNDVIKGHEFKLIELVLSEETNIGVLHDSKDDYSKWLGVSEEQDARETIQAMGNSQFDWMVVDHYSIGERWEKLISPYVQNIMVIDDLANRNHDCDILLDQNWFENMEDRYSYLVSKSCKRLLGPEYALLRSEFLEARRRREPRSGGVERIFVFFGGVDPYNLTGMALKVLSESDLAHLTVDVVIGQSNIHRDEVQEMVQARENCELHVQVNNISSKMARADLGIGSVGVNTWERACLGLPAITIGFSENHQVLVKDLITHKYTTHLGVACQVDEGMLKQALLRKISCRDTLQKESVHLSRLTEGKGSIKVAEILMKSSLKITIVSDGDSWINSYMPSFIEQMQDGGHDLRWQHDISKVTSGDLCFLLGCSQIMKEEIMRRNKNNLVVHESNLPEGKGWSPLTWQVLEGKNTIPITLLEAGKYIDSGIIYLRDNIYFNGSELIDEMRARQAKYTFKICSQFVRKYPDIIAEGMPQKGEETFYRKRTKKESRLDVQKSIAEQFDLLRVVDNERYPAYFELNGVTYTIKIEKLIDENS
ncbi:MAG: UDP-2,4-diacetamido-2,4,6-trideoxy-beta-L-altropyranose hydrolase [Verrucomicrobiales bacterium]|nr:UDP-2,4-diacetamido-2,4,6-trideoxy-beta-L-altropyranose hydrolase [Verrucomicrobiales bacterium]|tara:strand:+ start:6043 stop:7788 length:1746 start_codon:yes stop_codon:yes gene_type:complete